MNDHLYHRQLGYFAACLIPLLLASVAGTFIMYRYSADRGIWPLVLGGSVVLSLVYAALACLPAHRIGRFPVRLALTQHVLLAAVLVLHTLAYFLDKPDWHAVQGGGLRLTLLQRVVYSNWTPWWIYLVFYLALVWRIGMDARRR